MSPKIPSRVVALLALGLVWSATRIVARPQDAPDPAPAVTASAAPSPTVLLLTNGKVHQGTITEDATGYVLKHRIGVMHFLRRNVERTFGTIDETYHYLAERTPPNDPDERLKLAVWCLEQKMIPRAKEQLEAVLQLSPANRRAKAMLFNIQAASRSSAPRDGGVVQTGAEVSDPAEQPAELRLNALREAARLAPKPDAIPEILNLPRALAFRRYQEFARYVHPELQKRCASCHNERSQSDFQLIQSRSRRDLSNELLVRGNLDATLRLVDRDELARSPLLTALGMAHGPTNKPIVSGPNHPSYRMVLNWVNGLKPPAAATDESIGRDNLAAPAPPVEAFAADRRPATEAAPNPRAASSKVSAPPPAAPAPRPQMPTATAPPTPVGAVNPAPVVTVGGKSFAVTSPPGSPLRVVEAPPTPAAGQAPGTLKVPKGAKTITLPDGSVVPYVDVGALPAKPPGPAAKGKPKPTTIDRSYLEKFMSNRAPAPAASDPR